MKKTKKIMVTQIYHYEKEKNNGYVKTSKYYAYDILVKLEHIMVKKIKMLKN